MLDVEELRACGLTDDGIWVRVRNRAGCTRSTAAYTPSATAHLPLEGCFLAAVKACGERRVAEPRSRQVRTGCIRLGGTPGSGGPRPRRRGAPEHPQIRAYETSYLPPEDVVVHQGQSR